MPQPKRRAGATAPARKGLPALPEITNEKFRTLLRMLDEIVEASTDVYVEHGHRFGERKRQGTGREFTAAEIGPIARGLDTTLADARQQLVGAGLRSHDEPADTEVMIAAAIGTAPEIYDALVRLTLLVEMSVDEFDKARAGDLTAALDQAREQLANVGMSEMRQRVARAWTHISDTLGYQPGKAWGLIAKTIWQVVSQGMTTLQPATSSSSPSTDSPAATAGPDEK